MKKGLTLISLLILSIACLSGYLILNKLIFEGSLRILAGEKQIAEGQLKLQRGKARLARGEKELSRGKKTYQGMTFATPLELASTVVMPVFIASVAANKVASDKISQGDQLVAQGREKIRAGEMRLAIGQEQLQQGIRRLNQAKWLRIFCGLGTVVFAVLFFGLGYLWKPRRR